MRPYPKIQSVFKRDENTHKFIEGAWSCPEFEYLKDNEWGWTEKVDGTNIRVMWNAEESELRFGGKSDNAQIPPFLLDKLQKMFTVDQMLNAFPETSVCLYGEGYGARIQKGGGNYIPDGVSFILIDVLIEDWWLLRDNIEEIAETLGIEVVPIVGRGTLGEAVYTQRESLCPSMFGKHDFRMEGYVLKPAVELKTRRGDRVITKVKYKDF